MVIPGRMSPDEVCSGLPQRSAQDVAGAGPGEAMPEARDLAQLDARAQDRWKQRIAEHAQQMQLHLVVEASGSGRVRAGIPSVRLRLAAVVGRSHAS
jgi:hypothetical protein